MTLSETRDETIAAVRLSAIELGLLPLEAAVVDRIVDYGIEALIECTLAKDQPVTTDTLLRGALYDLSIARLSSGIALKHCELALAA